MSNTLGKLHQIASKATDEMLRQENLVVPLFVEIDGQTYSITVEQFKKILAKSGESDNE